MHSIQLLVDRHANLVKSRAARLVNRLEGVSRELRMGVDSYLRRSLDIVDGVVEPTANNALIMRDLDRQYTNSLDQVGYHAALAEFIGNFSDQVDEYRTMYDQMQLDSPHLPDMPLNGADGSLLATRAALSLASLDSTTVEVVASLRQASALTLGRVPVDQLLEYIGSIVDRTAHVDPLAKDLEMTFFRSIGGLVYRNLEDSGYSLLYTYQGMVGPNNRPFCKGLIGSAPRTRAQIEVLNNGKIPGVFDNAGGPNCSHFWWISGATK